MIHYFTLLLRRNILTRQSLATRQYTKENDLPPADVHGASRKAGRKHQVDNNYD